MKFPGRGRDENSIQKQAPLPGYASLLLAAQPSVLSCWLTLLAGRRETSGACSRSFLPLARSVVTMESGSGLHLGGLSREEIKSVTAACGLEACCRIETCFSAPSHVSKYYVMSEFHLHSSVLNFPPKGSVCSLMLSIYHPCHCRMYHSKWRRLCMSGKGGKPPPGRTWS